MTSGPEPDWRWGTADGSREFDQLGDRAMSFREKLEWLEKTERLALRMQASIKVPPTQFTKPPSPPS